MAPADHAEDVRGDQTIADQQDSLALVIARGQQARSAAQRTPGMIEDSEDDQVFLCGFASGDSFVGALDDEDSITDEGIEDFIRQNNPDMFRRLFTDEDTFTKGHAQNSGTGYHASTPTVKLDVTAANHGLDIFSSPLKYYELQHVLLQVKRLLVSSLLGGHVLILQKLASSYTVCGHPYCQFSHAPIPRGSFILQLRLDGAPQVRHFCLGCIESVFSCRAASARCHTSLPLAPMVALDGMKEVIEAAQKLAAPLPKINGVNGATPSLPKSRRILPLRQEGHACIQNYFKPDFPFDHPSNSLQALSLRRRRDAEINEILADVDKYDKRRQDDSGQPQKSPLAITPPPQMPGEERYKKQGLGRWDKEKEQRMIDKRDTNSGSSGTFTSSTESPKARICKCREPSGVGVVLRCSAEFCPTGYFHLECTALLQKPATNLVWTCSDCSGFPKGSLIVAEASGKGEELEMDDEYEYGYFYDDDDDDDGEEEEELSNEDFDSHDDHSECNRMLIDTGRRTVPLDDLFDGDCMLPVTGMKAASPEEPTTSPRAVETANEFTFMNQGSSEQPVTPPRHITLNNSFTPINSNHTPGTVTPSSIRHIPLFSLDGGQPAGPGQVVVCLPVGWSEVTFEDLAPFIIAETNAASYRTLAPEHMGMLEEWRAACPISRLLPGQRALNPFHVNNVQTVPLSHLLAMVEAEMAKK